MCRTHDADEPGPTILDDVLDEPLTDEQRRRCLAWWDKHLDRSMREVFEGTAPKEAPCP